MIVLNPEESAPQLLLKLDEVPRAGGQLAAAVASLQVSRAAGGWLNIGAVADESSLPGLNAACRGEGIGAILLAPLAAPAAADAPYARLWDRTEDFARAFHAWGEGRGGFPRLEQGELVRLPF